MLSNYSALTCSCVSSSRAFRISSSLCFLPPTPKALASAEICRLVRAYSCCADESDSAESQRAVSGVRTNYGGIRLEETVDLERSKKLRLDSWVSSHISGISRARVQSSIRSGLVSVNGQIVNKASYMVRGGDKIDCTISELKPLRAEPEDMPLDIVYEDEHLLVINKPPHMVVHPAPGNVGGTLVNGILHHCSLPTVAFSNHELLSETEDASDDELSSFSVVESYNGGISSGMRETFVRPGIVHRLDKGTSGLLVVAKDEHSHADLAEQFKQRTIKRVYISLTCGVPSSLFGRVDIPIGRDLNNRIRMAAFPGSLNCAKTRYAASRYRVIEILADGGSALVEWRLETGRTHQIRAHAKYLGIPLLGDEVYGGTKGMAMSLLQPRIPSSLRDQIVQVVSGLERPCLHALTLGFRHPYTRENIHFSQPPPSDFTEVLSQIRAISSEKAIKKDGLRQI